MKGGSFNQKNEDSEAPGRVGTESVWEIQQKRQKKKKKKNGRD